MNKRTLFFLAGCLAVLIPGGGLAQDYGDPQNGGDSGKPYGQGTHAPVEVPPGMELISVGGIRMIVQQGTKIDKKGNLVVMEGVDEFAARNFKEMGARLERIEMSQNELRKAVDDLKLEISDRRKK